MNFMVSERMLIKTVLHGTVSTTAECFLPRLHSEESNTNSQVLSISEIMKLKFNFYFTKERHNQFVNNN